MQWKQILGSITDFIKKDLLRSKIRHHKSTAETICKMTTWPDKRYQNLKPYNQKINIKMYCLQYIFILIFWLKEQHAKGWSLQKCTFSSSENGFLHLASLHVFLPTCQCKRITVITVVWLVIIIISISTTNTIIIIIINRQFLTRRNMEPHRPFQGRELSMCREIQCCFDMSIVNYS